MYNTNSNTATGFNPFLQLDLAEKWILVSIMCFISTIATTVYLHRHKTHNALKLNRVVGNFFQLILWLNTGVKSALWVIIHKQHHKYSDQGEDLHSPKNPIRVLGLKFRGPIVPILKYFVLYKPVKNQKTKTKMDFVMRDEGFISKNIYHKLSWLGPIILLSSYLFLFGFDGIWMFFIQFLYLPVVAGGLINGFGHGSKKSHDETRDYSNNLLGFINKLPKPIYYGLYPVWFCLRMAIDLMTGGEWRHYAHHFKLNSAKITLKKFEIDTGWIVVYMLFFLRLANHVKYYSQGQMKELNFS